MQLIIDLPFSLKTNVSGIKDPCLTNENDIGCSYLKWFGEYPLNFNDRNLLKQSQVNLVFIYILKDEYLLDVNRSLVS